MKVDAGRGRLHDALKMLRHRWDEVEPFWTDAVRRDFEEKVLTPLTALSEDALRAMDRLTQVFNQARRECAGEPGVGDGPS